MTTMKKMLGAIGLGCAATSLFFAPQAGATQIQERNIKAALVVNKDTAQYEGLQKFADLVGQKSGGKMKVRIYGGGTLGNDLQTLSSLQGGTVEIMLSNASLLQGLNKEMAVYDFPFLFNNEKEADALVDGPIGTRLLSKLPEKGVVGLAYWELGFRHVMNSVRPINKAEDMNGLKIRVIQTPIYIDFINATGANAVPLPFTELYNALEQKTIDGCTNPFITVMAQKFNEVQKYLSITNHMYNPQVLMLSKKFWDKLSDDEKKVLSDAAIEARDYQRQISRQRNAEALEKLKTVMAVNVVPPQEIARMRQKAAPVIAKYSESVGPALVNEINTELEKIRKNGK